MATSDYIFKGPEKLIELTITSSISVQDMYSRWKEWLHISDNTKFLQAMRSVGGDPITDTKSLGSTYFLTNGWVVQPYTSSHTLDVNGNLYAEDTISGSLTIIDPIQLPSGSYQILVRMNVSNLIDTLTLDSSLAQSIEYLNTKMSELWTVHGLDNTNPLTVNTTSRVAGDVTQSINYNSGSNETIVTRT